MSRGLNEVKLIGNLGDDPTIRYTTEGKAVATLSIATSKSWTDRATGEQRTDTQWHRVKCFGGLAEVVKAHCKKGRQLYVSGALRHEKYTDKDGIERWSADVVADELILLGSRPTDGTGNEGASSDPTEEGSPAGLEG